MTVVILFYLLIAVVVALFIGAIIYSDWTSEDSFLKIIFKGINAFYSQVFTKDTWTVFVCGNIRYYYKYVFGIRGSYKFFEHKSQWLHDYLRHLRLNDANYWDYEKGEPKDTTKWNKHIKNYSVFK